MNVASLDLCRELYGLSRWEDTDFQYHRGLDDEWHSAYQKRGYPAYDLGYLLRKLPRLDSYNDSWSLVRWSDEWIMEHGDIDGDVTASNPEDAAAKLTIGLFNKGILKRKAA
jgi:hypothetical protein